MRLPKSRALAATPQVIGPMLFLALLIGVVFVHLADGWLVSRVVRWNAARAAGESRTAAPSQTQPINRVLIQVLLERAQPRWIVSGRKFENLAELRQLLEKIAAADANTRVTLDAAAEVTLGDAVDLHDACREVGLKNTEFAVGEP